MIPDMMPSWLLSLLFKVEREMAQAKVDNHVTLSLTPAEVQKLDDLTIKPDLGLGLAPGQKTLVDKVKQGTCGKLTMEMVNEAYRQIMATRSFNSKFTGWKNLAAPGPMFNISPAMTWDEEPEKPAPKLETEHIIGTITGYRRWKTSLLEDLLFSVNGTVWPAKEKLASVCKFARTGGCGGVKCSCGIYSWRSMEACLVESNAAVGMEHGDLYGPVSLWGRVLQCEYGYRAQFAYPKAILDTGERARKIAEVYGVPLMKDPA